MLDDQPIDPPLRIVVDEVVERWRDGGEPDALAVLTEYPQILDRHSLAVDLAYEEYCIREEMGVAPDPQQFCNKFSQFGHSLARMLKLHSVLRSKSHGGTKCRSINWPATGKQWLDWVLIEEIGRGAFSRVFIAEEPALGNRRVVVKCSTSGGEEAFVLGKFNNSNLMPVHSIRHDQDRGLVGICMPLVGRVTMAQVLDRIHNTDPSSISAQVFSPAHGVWPADPYSRPTSASKRWVYAVEVAILVEKISRGLTAAHAAGVLHGDIKPSNIILSFEGEPLLVDFNLSTDARRSPERLGGTPPYMAPERLELLSLEALNRPVGNTKIDFRSDVFSLGVVLFEFLFGKTPYETQINDETLTYQNSLPALTGVDITRQILALELQQIVKRAIAFDVEDRFSSASELADALASFIRKQKAATSRPTNWWWRSAAIVVASLIVIPVVVSYIPATSDKPASQKFSLEHENLRLAIEDIDKRKFVFALERLEDVQAARPLPQISEWIGYCFAQRKDIVLAREHFALAAPESDPTGVSWHNLAYGEYLGSMLPEAIEHFSRAVEVNPQLRESFHFRAVAQRKIASQQTPKLRLPEGSIADIERALSLGPDLPYMQLDAARIYAHEFGFDESPALRANAERCIRRALELGVPLASFDSTLFEKFRPEKLAPPSLPVKVDPPEPISGFLVPQSDLKAILATFR